MKVDYSYWQIFYDPNIPLAERVGWAALSPIIIPLATLGSMSGCGTRTYTGNVYIENSDTGMDVGNITLPDATTDTSAHDSYTSDLPPDMTLADTLDESTDILNPPDLTPDITVIETDTEIPPGTCPSQVVLPNSCNIVGISAGQTSTVVAMKDGTVRGWGKISGMDFSQPVDFFSATTPTKINGFQNITQVSIRFQHLLALDSFGNVSAMGQNAWGQLGNGKSPITTGVNEDSKTPVTVLNLSNVVSISAGDFHSMALDKSGDVYTWGFNAKGQLGLPDPKNPNAPLQLAVSQPTVVTFPQKDAVVTMGSGDLQSYAVKASGSGYMWGDYTGTAVFSPGFADKGILKIAGGLDFACLLGNGCGISCAGSITSKPTFTLIASLSKLSDVIAGGQTAIAITQTGDAYIWGDNSSGQSGLGLNNAIISPPTQIGLGKIAMASIATDHICVVTSGCEVYCAGANQAGQLGNGSTTPSSTWVKVTGLP